MRSESTRAFGQPRLTKPTLGLARDIERTRDAKRKQPGPTVEEDGPWGPGGAADYSVGARILRPPQLNDPPWPTGPTWTPRTAPSAPGAPIPRARLTAP